MDQMAPDDNDRDEEEAAHPVVVIQNPDQLNQRDDDAIVGMLTGQAIEEYVYSFRQGGRLVQGLTLAGINEAANRRGGIQVDEVQFEERETSWIATVKAVDTYTGNSRFGAYEQSKKSGGREDPHAFTKAVHKAQRNAIKQLLPTPIIKEVINYYLQAQARPAAVTAEEPPIRDEAPADTITNHQKAAFAIAQRMRDALQRHQISQQDFWNYVRRRFNVQSRNEMREEQWAVLAAELNAATTSKEQFGELVAKVAQVLQAERDTSGPLVRDEPDAPDASPDPDDDDDEGTVIDAELDENKSELVGSDTSRREKRHGEQAPDTRGARRQ
jgi:hypothetical protein